MDLRRLGLDDLPQSRQLSAEAFGRWPEGSTPPPLPTELPAGRREWGAFDDGRLVARVVVLDHHSWWGGHRVPSAGIAGVAVAAEHRGGGLLARLFALATAEAREQGAVLSTLYPTANGIYRGLGYELVSSYDTVEVPTAELARISAPPTIRTRRAGTDDLPAVFAVYDAWAAQQAGPLTRTGPRFAERDQVLEHLSAITLALDAEDRVVGYLAWERGRGYGPEASLEVRELLATSTDAYRALWRVAGSFASVTGRVRITTSGADPARLVLPSMTWDVVARHPYMLRVLDLPGALGALAPTLPGGGTAALDLTVVGDRLGHVDGGYRVTLGDGPVGCEPADPVPGAPVVTIQGLALLVAGAQSCGNLRLLGMLTGDDRHDRVLDVALGGRQLHVRDYF